VNDLNNAELRRALRDMGATAQSDHRAMRTSLRALFDSDATADQRRAALVGRRRFLTIGGLSVATASVIAACGGTDSPGAARVGLAPTRTDLPDASPNDIVYLRTASSIEYSAIAVYDLVIGNTDLLAAELQDAAKRFRDDHVEHATIFEDLTKDLGGEAWTCGNPRIDRFLVAPVINMIVGDEATDTPPSDDPQRDTAAFAHALENLAGETYQMFVGLLSEPALRKTTIQVGAAEVRHAAILAMAITGTPEGYVPPADAGEPPVFPVAYAIPSQFGSLSGQQLVVGAADELGVRRPISVDTPSNNTFVFEYMTPEC
jgi:hypothetical protein